MKAEFLSDPKDAKAGLPFSAAVRAGPFIFVSGQVPKDDHGVIVAGGIEVQTRAAIRNIERALALAGCALADVVKTTVWLADARDFGAFNRAYAEFFGDDRPARSTTQARLVIDAKVEIEAIAYKP